MLLVEVVAPPHIRSYFNFTPYYSPPYSKQTLHFDFNYLIPFLNSFYRTSQTVFLAELVNT